MVTQLSPKQVDCIYICWSVISGKLSLCCVFVSSLFLCDWYLKKNPEITKHKYIKREMNTKVSEQRGNLEHKYQFMCIFFYIYWYVYSCVSDEVLTVSHCCRGTSDVCVFQDVYCLKRFWSAYLAWLCMRLLL